MTPASVVRLKQLLARELSSLLSYLAGAWPWSSTRERAMVEELQALLAQEQEAQLKLATLLRKARVVPPTARFPMDFTTKHFLALDYLLPLVISEQEGLLARLEADLAAFDPDEAKEAVASYTQMKANHLDALRQLAGGVKATV